MVIVVPPFPECKESDPPIVPRVVLGVVPAITPGVGCRVDEPGDVVNDGESERDTP